MLTQSCLIKKDAQSIQMITDERVNVCSSACLERKREPMMKWSTFVTLRYHAGDVETSAPRWWRRPGVYLRCGFHSPVFSAPVHKHTIQSKINRTATVVALQQPPTMNSERPACRGFPLLPNSSYSKPGVEYPPPPLPQKHCSHRRSYSSPALWPRASHSWVER